MIKPRYGAEAALALTHRGGAGKHGDRRTKRLRTKGAQRRAAIQEQRDR